MAEQRWRHQHPAVDDVMKVLSKASRELLLVQRQLEQEFQLSYPENVNPCKIVVRIKKIQDDLVALKELCRELLAEKQDLIDKARTTLARQRDSMQMILSSFGLPSMSESDDMAYTNLNQVIDEWTTQVRAKTGDEKDAGEDINQMLFSALVQNN